MVGGAWEEAPPVSKRGNRIRREPRQADAERGMGAWGAESWRWAPRKKPAWEGGRSETEKTATQSKKEKEVSAGAEAKPGQRRSGQEWKTEKPELNQHLTSCGDQSEGCTSTGVPPGRFNRRTTRSRGLLYYRLLQQAVKHQPIPKTRLSATSNTTVGI
jgi:hypothetical protein